MKAVIVAAGIGSRLLPYTNQLPKCLLNVGGRPILEYQISALQEAGIRDIVVVIGHCGDQIRKHLKTQVTFIENKDYLSTNSSYSFWMTKEHTREGCLYLNSDLIFSPDILRRLLNDPAPDAIIVDPKVDHTSGMHKAEIIDGRIIHMEKNLDPQKSHAEVVGPVKLSKEGVRIVIDHIQELVDRNEKNIWMYEILNRVSKKHPIAGISTEGLFWTEIDTPDDLILANQNIPAYILEETSHLVSKSLAPRKKFYLVKNPVEYMDTLLGSDLQSVIKKFDNFKPIVEKKLSENRKLFLEKIQDLNIKKIEVKAVHDGLKEKLFAIENKLQKYFGMKEIGSLKDFGKLIESIFAVTEKFNEKGWYLSEETARKILSKLPPKNLLKSAGCGTMPELLKKINAVAIISLTRYSENKDWQIKYQKALTQVKKTDLTQRKVQSLVINEKDFESAFQSSGQQQKPWHISHNKETGVVTCFYSVEAHKEFELQFLQFTLVFLHYFFESLLPARCFAKALQESPNTVGEVMVDTINTNRDKFPFFYPNLYSETLFWKRALIVFEHQFRIPGFKWFMDCLYCGEFDDDKKSIISLNIIDHIWNINFIKTHLYNFEHDSIYFLYHFRNSLWQEIITAVSKEENLETFIIENLHKGDQELTRMITDSYGKK